MKIYRSVSELVGRTPLFDVSDLAPSKAAVYAKLEYFNPTGSVKDRAAMNMLDDAEKRGKLKNGAVIIEPTSGNTGIGLAAIGASRGYKVILTMPETMSIERQKMLKAYGAEIVLTEGAKGMAGAVLKAEELAREYENAFIPSQFDNPANPEAHYLATGREIFEDTDGRIDIFVAGVGTGGTVSGTGKYLKEKKPDVEIVGFEPASSPLLTGGTAGAHAIQGIGANFVPKNFDESVVDRVLTVSNEDAFSFGRLMVAKKGLLVGISSGAALAAAFLLAAQPENSGKTIVTLLPDSGDRYFSTDLFNY